LGSFISPQFGLTSVLNAQNANVYSTTKQECCRIVLNGVAIPTGRSKSLYPNGKKQIPIPEWEKVYQEQARERKLLYQARVLGWGKEKRYYFAQKRD